MKWQDGLLYGSVANEFNLGKTKHVVSLMIENWLSVEIGAVIIGYDTRFQSDLAAQAAAEVLVARHIPVIFAKEPVPWGAIQYALRQRKAAAGLMITGGDKGIEYNGMRFIHSTGKMLTQEEWEAWIGMNLQAEKASTMDFQLAASDGCIEILSLMDQYLHFLRKTVDIPKIKSSTLTVLIDSLYGGGQGIASRLFRNEKENILEIHQTRHSLFGGLVPQPAGRSLEDLKNHLLSLSKHLGIAWDGEGRHWSWVNRFTGNIVEGCQMEKLIRKYLINQSKEVPDFLFSQDGILQSLLFLEWLIVQED